MALPSIMPPFLELTPFSQLDLYPSFWFKESTPSGNAGQKMTIGCCLKENKMAHCPQGTLSGNMGTSSPWLQLGHGTPLQSSCYWNPKCAVSSTPNTGSCLNKGGNQGWMSQDCVLCPVTYRVGLHFKTKQSPRLCSAVLQRLVLDLFPAGVDSSHWCSPSSRGGGEGGGWGVCCCAPWNSNLEGGWGHMAGEASAVTGVLASTQVIAMGRCGLTPGLPHCPYPGPPDLLGAPEPGPNPQPGQNPWATPDPEPPGSLPVTQALQSKPPDLGAPPLNSLKGCEL